MACGDQGALAEKRTENTGGKDRPVEKAGAARRVSIKEGDQNLALKATPGVIAQKKHLNPGEKTDKKFGEISCGSKERSVRKRNFS